MSTIAQTPQRPLPGAYVQTPAVSFRQNPTRAGSTAIVQPNGSRSLEPAGGPTPNTTSDSPISRAARYINDTLGLEARYPELNTYVGQGISSEYDAAVAPGWAPFEQVKTYSIPDRIFEQYNRAQASTSMGLFADINYAWIAIDNALYLWDYTHPTPNLIGYEERQTAISAVRMIKPRPGVFVEAITRLLVVANQTDIFLIGVSCSKGPGGGQVVDLYETKMSVSIKGMSPVNHIDCSKNGRIFFIGKPDNDIYEVTYTQEEGWFQSRCGKINRTAKGVYSLVPSISFGLTPLKEHIVQMVVDNSRNLIYTLSSKSTIRTYHMKSNEAIEHAITKPLGQTLNDIGHMTSQSELISPDMRIVALHPVSAQEASRIHLMATTSTGCRIFLSATSGYGYANTNAANAPSSMQVQHVKFPPPVPLAPQALQQPSNQLTVQGTNINSRTLQTTRTASRYPPGYFFCFVQKDSQSTVDTMFVAAPDAGRIGRPQEIAMAPRFTELGLWVSLGSRAEDIGLVTEPASAADTPIGFANELAIQYDKPVAEVAVLTNTGVYTFRRRRLVDMFAATIRLGGGDEGLEGEMKKFIRLYGRGETAATALAVACGQGTDVTADSRVARVTDPEVLEYARKAFIEYGGKPLYNENSSDQTQNPIDMVRPSPRHEGLSLYISRLIRSLWKTNIVTESTSPMKGLKVESSIKVEKLRDTQQDLTKLQEFLSVNKSFIDGLAGAEALRQMSSRQDEIALQAEHRALHSLVVLISNMIEGISFVQVLFDERIEEIILSLSNEVRSQVRGLTYERLFCSTEGKELAKELVKAIVNRNIANGSNVDTVAEALRRRCGSFCSAEDVIIFKAQEQLKKATAAGANSEYARNLLNESLRLYKQVAANLTTDQLQEAIGQYVQMQFFAGAIELVLAVAREKDRGNRALAWIQEGRPQQDARANAFEARKLCYNMIHQVMNSLEQASANIGDGTNGQAQAERRRSEAYQVVNESDDEVFQTDLYDWYLENGQADRLLSIQSPFVVNYLKRKSEEDVTHADLLWRHHIQTNRYHDAAAVQLALAKSAFVLPLDRRIEHLSRAKANASTFTAGVSRQSRQALLREISDLLDVANIQDDLLQRLKEDARLLPERRIEVLGRVDGPILSLSDMYNIYADPAGYFDICILIYHAADYRDPTDIRNTWRNLIDAVHTETTAQGQIQPYEAIVEKLRELGSRLNLSETAFPIPDLVPMVEAYAYLNQRNVGSPTWVMDLFLDLRIPYESIFPVLEAMFYNDEAPFHGNQGRVVIGNDMVYIAQRWYQDSSRGTGRLFGSETNALAISQTLEMLERNGLDAERVEACQVLRARIDQAFR